MTDGLWNGVLALRVALSRTTQPVHFACLSTSGKAALNEPLSGDKVVYIGLGTGTHDPLPGQAYLQKTDALRFSIRKHGDFDAATLQYLRTYLPYLFLTQMADHMQRACTVAHFAQSLDGKIATESGHSKWIGNDENLVHAHRMRALCDAVLIGGGTLACDRPRLTVRHVAGEHPVRVVVGRPDADYDSLLQACDQPIFVYGAADARVDAPVDYTQLPDLPDEGRVCSVRVLKALYSRGIRTVYLEGGPTTTSRFLKDGAVDILQLHISPMLFGSGMGAVQFAPITKVDEAIAFRSFTFEPVGDTMMFVGIPENIQQSVPETPEVTATPKSQ
ncbi:RibD family protein [Phaeodactylibacter xiamenensis]|uniref:RibD family protein n=1 Tax=Phaeodactylibacter xiamenensis TaxID=1524460 RepID=UPI003BA9417D